MQALWHPLSAAAWVNRLFVPVYVRYGDTFMAVGLLAKHARQQEADRQQPGEMLSVGQHSSGATMGRTEFGKDIFLVHPDSKIPVGILPDFLPDVRTDEEFQTFARVLYSGLCRPSSSQSDVPSIAQLPLKAVEFV
jgi:hypothetical protein